MKHADAPPLRSNADAGSSARRAGDAGSPGGARGGHDPAPRRRRLLAPALLLGAAALASACDGGGSATASGGGGASSSSSGGGGAGGGTGGDPCAAVEPPVTAAADIGAACAGACDGGLCFPGPGGYCTVSCGNSDSVLCPEGSACVSTLRAGDLCMKSCATGADCRAGYTCDPARLACVPPGLVPSPDLARCAEPALAKAAFGPARQISAGQLPGDHDLEPAAALGDDGGLAVAYMTNGTITSPNELHLARLDAGGALLGGQPFTTDRTHYFDPWMARDRGGRRYLAFLAYDFLTPPPSHQHIQLVTSDDGETWSAPVAAEDAADCPNDEPDCLDKPMVAVGPDKADPTADAVYVFYFSEPAGGMRVTRSTDRGETFSASDPVGAEGAYGDARVAGDGDLHAVFVEGGGDPLGDASLAVIYRRSSDGGKTFSAAQVSASGEPVPFFFSNPHLALDEAKGLIYVVYTSGSADGAWDVMLATSADGGQTFTRTKVNDDAPCATHMMPAAAVDPKTGAVHVTWSEDRSGEGALGYAVCASGGASCGENERVNDAPFAAFQLVRHSRIWLGEYGQLLFDPAQRRLHAIWTQPVDECGAPVSRIFHAGRDL